MATKLTPSEQDAAPAFEELSEAAYHAHEAFLHMGEALPHIKAVFPSHYESSLYLLRLIMEAQETVEDHASSLLRELPEPVSADLLRLIPGTIELTDKGRALLAERRAELETK